METNNWSAIRPFLEKGADPDQVCRTGETPLSLLLEKERKRELGYYGKKLINDMKTKYNQSGKKRSLFASVKQTYHKNREVGKQSLHISAFHSLRL